MIDYKRAKEMMAASHEDGCATGSLDGITATVTEAAHLTVHEALRVYRIKAWSAQQAGIDARGVDRTLQRLAERKEDENVMIFLLDDTSRSYFVFVSEADEALIGCMSVPRRPHKVAPPDWDGVTKFWKDDES